jgi:hypothetical protein
MKQNMCVTIDEAIHSWLRSKPEMMSRVVNKILLNAMIKELHQDVIKVCNICSRRSDFDDYSSKNQTNKCTFCIRGKMIEVKG